MFLVLSSWQSHCESSPGSFDECKTAPSGRRPNTKPDDLGCQSLHPPSPFISITQRHLLVLLSPKADTHFTIPWRVEGWVDLVCWLHRWFTRPRTVTHPGTNRVWRSATTLIEANALPNHQLTYYKLFQRWSTQPNILVTKTKWQHKDLDNNKNYQHIQNWRN